VQTKRVIVELSPSARRDRHAQGPGASALRCERFGRAEWPQPYSTALPEATVALSRLVDEVYAKGAVATVIYSAPGAVSAVTSCATACGLAAGETAAMLALANVADFPLETPPPTAASC